MLMCVLVKGIDKERFYILVIWFCKLFIFVSCCFICSSSRESLAIRSVSNDRKDWKTHVATWLSNWSRGPTHGHFISADGNWTCHFGHVLPMCSSKLHRCNPVCPQIIHLTRRQSTILRTIRVASFKLDANTELRQQGHDNSLCLIHLEIHWRQNVWSHGVLIGSIKGLRHIEHLNSQLMESSPTYS